MTSSPSWFDSSVELPIKHYISSIAIIFTDDDCDIYQKRVLAAWGRKGGGSAGEEKGGLRRRRRGWGDFVNYDGGNVDEKCEGGGGWEVWRKKIVILLSRYFSE